MSYNKLLANNMIHVRPASSSDQHGVYPLARDMATSYQVVESDFLGVYESVVSSSHMCLGVAEDKDKIVGYVIGSYHPCFYANGNVAWVEEIMVDVGFRGRGAGRQLMQYFEGWAKSSGCKLVALATRRASDFYLALGYEESATYFKKQLM
jgi:GNAT superfamily N-acetyltransferase